MKSIKFNQLIMFLFGLLCLVACEDPAIPDINDENQQNSKPSPEIKIDVSSVDFGSEGGSDTISFTSTDDWTAELINSRADDWCSITPKTGKAGSAKISVTLQQNETTDNRSASIIIKSGSVNKTVTVNQKQKDALTITASKFEVGPEGGEITIEVKANIDFEYEIEGSAQEWISYQTTRAMKTSTLVFNVAKNDDIEKREGKITIRSGEFNEVVTVYQEGAKPSIILSQNEYVIPTNSQTITVDVKSNVDVEVEIPQDVTWIKENATRAYSTDTYHFEVERNDCFENRTAEISFTNKENGICEKVKIVQMQRDAIIVADLEYSFGADGGELDFEVQTNVDLTVQISDNATSWIKQIETRSLETKTLHFDIAAFSSEEIREGTINISGGRTSQTITVKQSGLKEILETERKALIEFYIAAGGDNWVHKDNWCSDKPVSEWYGITCDKTGRASSIYLTYNNLSGYLSESICKLNNLRAINLGRSIRGGQVYDRKDMNSIIIRIPEQINECKELTEINFAGLTLEGEIPSSFSELTKLTYILLCQSMSNNTTGLTGEIPDLNKMENLSLLDLSHNSLTGEIPDLQKNRKLTELELSNNSLTGEIPDFTNHLQLKWIALSNNNLYGRLPEFSSTKLQWIKLSNNNLEYSIPASYAVLLKQLESLSLYNNRLSGKLPEEILISPEFPLFVSSILVPQQDGYGIDISEIPAVKNTYATIDGGTVNLGEIYAKNKYTILYRWSETCPYAYLSTPIVVNTYNKYKDKGLGVLGFYPGSNQDNNKDYMISTGMDSWTHVAELQENYGVTYGDHPIWRGAEESYFTPLIEVVDSYGNLIFVSDESFTNLSIMHPRDELPEFIETLLGSNGNEEIYNSKDFSSDGIVKTLQKASKGNGINIILMGDGYSDRLIADGTYYSDMETMVDAFFHEEPYKSHKDLFNIYVVYAVSKNEVYTTGTSTAIECKFGEGTYVEGKHSKCIEYALKAISESQMNEALILVGINRIKHSGTCHMFLPENNGDYASGLSISYFSVMDPYQLRLLVSHEAGGHGFAKLGDEYWYEDNGRIPSDVLNQKLKESRDFGWWKNIDFTNDPNKVKWSHFLCDDRYIPEKLGVFEGGSTYTYGVYRSTENSVMRNSQGYNAPSREAIYYRIHKLAYGLDWQYNFEDFVESDLINRESSIQTDSKTTQKSKVNYVEVIYQNLPVIINQTWRDAMKYTDSSSEHCR